MDIRVPVNFEKTIWMVRYGFDFPAKPPIAGKTRGFRAMIVLNPDSAFLLDQTASSGEEEKTMIVTCDNLHVFVT